MEPCEDLPYQRKRISLLMKRRSLSFFLKTVNQGSCLPFLIRNMSYGMPMIVDSYFFNSPKVRLESKYISSSLASPALGLLNLILHLNLSFQNSLAHRKSVEPSSNSSTQSVILLKNRRSISLFSALSSIRSELMGFTLVQLRRMTSGLVMPVLCLMREQSSEQGASSLMAILTGFSFFSVTMMILGRQMLTFTVMRRGSQSQKTQSSVFSSTMRQMFYLKPSAQRDTSPQQTSCMESSALLQRRNRQLSSLSVRDKATLILSLRSKRLSVALFQILMVDGSALPPEKTLTMTAELISNSLLSRSTVDILLTSLTSSLFLDFSFSILTFSQSSVGIYNSPRSLKVLTWRQKSRQALVPLDAPVLEPYCLTQYLGTLVTRASSNLNQSLPSRMYAQQWPPQDPPEWTKTAYRTYVPVGYYFDGSYPSSSCWQLVYVAQKVGFFSKGSPPEMMGWSNLNPDARVLKSMSSSRSGYGFLAGFLVSLRSLRLFCLRSAKIYRFLLFSSSFESYFPSYFFLPRFSSSKQLTCSFPNCSLVAILSSEVFLFLFLAASNEDAEKSAVRCDFSF